MTDEEQFSIWWANVGQRVRAFDARSWALSGWLGHKIHGGEAPIREEPKQIEDSENKVG